LETILETVGLVKRYGGSVAVDRLNLRVSRGEVYGFLGMNGAGKTTTIRMLLSLVRPDAGEIRLFGEPVSAARASALRRVGSMVEFPGFYENLSARENLALHARLRGLGKDADIAGSLAAAGLTDAGRKPVGQFSLGMRQRLGIARAILHQPELVILDEPTNGLDPVGIRDMRDLVGSLARERGIAVFMSSHVLSEVEQVADRVGVIHHGRLLDEIGIAELRAKKRAFVEFGVSDESRAAMLLESRMGITDFEVAARGTLRVFSSLDKRAAINRLLVGNGVDVDRVWQSETGLEEYFLALTGEKKA